MDNNYLIIFFCCLFFLFMYKFMYQYLIYIIFLNKYKNALDIFEYFCKKTYSLIYQDQIIGYSSNGMTSIPIDEYETIQRNYVKLVFNNMGSNNIKICVLFFGSKESLISNIILYLKEQITSDVLSKIIDNNVQQG